MINLAQNLNFFVAYFRLVSFYLIGRVHNVQVNLFDYLNGTQASRILVYAEANVAIAAITTNSFPNSVYFSYRFLISENEVTNVDYEAAHLAPDVFLLLQAILLFNLRVYIYGIKLEIIIFVSLAGCCLLFARQVTVYTIFLAQYLYFLWYTIFVHKT